MKTINIVSSSYPPEVSGGSNRVASISKNFEDNHYKVNIITLGAKNEIHKSSEDSTIYNLQRRDISNVGFVKRALYEMADSYKLTKKANSIPSDATIVSIPYMFLLPVYAFFGNNKNNIIDIRDVVWEYLPSNGVNKPIKKIVSILMYQSIKAFKKVSVTNQYEKNLISKKVKNANITVINNGINQEKYNLFSNFDSKKSEKIIISYIGCIGLAQNLITLIQAIEQLKAPNIIVNIVGTGNKKDELEAYAKKHQLSNIIFHGQRPWKELEKVYAETSILYAQLTKDYDSAVPSKLYEYAATGLPIIYGGVGESENFIAKLENAICIEPDNINTLTQAIESFQNQKFIKSKQNQQFIAENFVREKVNLQFLEIIKYKG